MTEVAPTPSSCSADAIAAELSDYLRPPGGGIHTVSTGKAELEAKTRAYLGEAAALDDWRACIRAALESRVVMLAIPSDTGAGIVRGAARGPEAIRAALERAPVPELGDVFCIPHLLDDEMLSDAQRARCAEALYANSEFGTAPWRPVSPLGMAQRVYALLNGLPRPPRVVMLGGDHTVTWAPMAELLSTDPSDNADIGIVHFDAHTDLLPARLGVNYCFATWAWHANQRLGGGERIIQLGIRASGHERGHWEQSLGVRQIWGDEARAMEPAALGALVVEHLKVRGLRRIYVTNDIDGTDAHWAAACGTPEPGGLRPDQVVAVYDALRDAGTFEFLGADVVEVAPGLSLDPAASARTVETAAQYTQSSLQLFSAGA